jgi:hypothetical protein
MTIQREEGLLPAAERFHLGTMQAAKAKSLANEVSELQSPTKPLVLSRPSFTAPTITMAQNAIHIQRISFRHTITSHSSGTRLLKA